MQIIILNKGLQRVFLYAFLNIIFFTVDFAGFFFNDFSSFNDLATAFAIILLASLTALRIFLVSTLVLARTKESIITESLCFKSSFTFIFSSCILFKYNL